MGAGRPVFGKICIGIAGKLAACLMVSTAAFFALFGYLNLRLERQHFERMVLLSAERISDILAGSARQQMLTNDREGLYRQIRDVGLEPGVERLRIFNKEGLISFSTLEREVGAMVDKSAEACYACHAQEAPLTRLARPDRARVFRTAAGERVLAVIRPVENRPECSNAACHAHPAGRRILGVIDAHLSLASVDAQIAEHQRQIIAVTGLAVVLISLVSAIFVWMVLHRPIRELRAGTLKVAEGDLTHRLRVRGNDELGELAESFNKMTAQLAQAHSELTEWARTLEDRVKKKTGELERAYSTLVASEKMASLGKLAATVAHEVNNPLFGMLTYARLTLKTLQSSEVSPAARQKMVENLSIIERESRRCGELMKNLLTFARQTPPHRSSSDLNELVGRALSLMRHQFELQGIEIETNLRPEIEAVYCDHAQIQQVLLVLLVNAAEAMPGGGLLSVGTRLTPDGSGAVICVRDSGCGIPAELLPKIFEPFFTTKETQQRTGLGLAIAKSIVESHQGVIEVRSVPGEGTEFHVILPLEAGVGAAAGAGQSREERT